MPEATAIRVDQVVFDRIAQQIRPPQTLKHAWEVWRERARSERLATNQRSSVISKLHARPNLNSLGSPHPPSGQARRQTRHLQALNAWADVGRQRPQQAPWWLRLQTHMHWAAGWGLSQTRLVSADTLHHPQPPEQAGPSGRGSGHGSGHALHGRWLLPACW